MREMHKNIELFSIFSLVLSQLLLISGEYESLQSPNQDFVLMSQNDGQIQLTTGERQIEIEHQKVHSCHPFHPLFGSLSNGNGLPECPPPSIPPLINRWFKNISVIYGQTIRFDVMFTGYPKPVITFQKNGIPIVSNERIKVSDKLIIGNAGVGDSGLYTMIAQNPGGSDRVNFMVNVEAGCPPKVRQFSPTTSSDHSIRLEWNTEDVPNVSYKVEILDNMTNTWKLLSTVPETNIHVKNLKCFLWYKFKVTAVANGCESEPLESKPIVGHNGVAEAISGPVTIAELLEDRMTIVWNPTINECGSPVTQYSVKKQYFNNSKEWIPIGITDAKRITETNIEGIFRYAIRAINGFGESAPFVTTYLTPVNMIDKCPKKAKGIVEVDGVTRDSVHLNWETCIQDKMANYYFQIEKTESDSSPVWEPVGNTSNRHFSVYQLKCYTNYKFRVKVLTPHCETVTIETNPTLTSGLPEPPPIPFNIDVLDVNTLNMDWTLPPIVCNTPIEGYVIEKQYITSNEWQFVAKTHENRFQEKNIEHSYRYRIRSINKFGESLPMISRILTPHEMLPKCLTGPLGVIEVDRVTRDSIKLGWEHCILDKNVHYTFQIEKTESGSGIWESLGKTVEYQTYVNLYKCRTEYRFRVTVVSPHCQPVTLETKPIITSGIPEPPPEPINIEVLDSNTLNMNWGIPPIICNTPSDEYLIEKQYITSDEWLFVAKTMENKFQDKNIEHSYRYRIRSINKFGESLPLITRELTPHEMLPKPKCPQKPEGMLEEDGLTRDSVLLRWDQCIKDPNGNYTFEIEIMESSSGIWETLGKINDFQTYATDLKCHTEYQFRVFVFTPNCETVTLPSKPIMTLGAPEPPPMPINIEVLDRKTLSMNWALPPIVCGTPIMGYIIEKQDINSIEWQFVGKTVENSFQVTNLTDSNRYRIKSINKFGESLPLISRELTPHEMQSCPQKPKGIVKIEGVGRDSVLLKWDHCIPEKDDKYSFQVQKSESGSGVWEPEPLIYVSESLVTQLKCHTEYNFRVNVFYPKCETATLETKPIKMTGIPEPPPMPISVEVLDVNTLNMNWALPPIVCNTPIVGYIIEKQYIDSKDWKYVAKTQENRYEDKNIAHSYRYRIRSINKFGESLPLISKVLTPHEMIPKPVCPEVHGIVKVSDVGSDSLLLNWDHCIPDKNRNYIFEIAKMESNSELMEVFGNTSVYETYVNGLKCHTEYTFGVTVFTPNCETVILETNPTLTSVVPEPPPMPIKVELLDVNTLSMNWKLPPIVCGTPIVGYVIEKQYISSNEWLFVRKTHENAFLDRNISNSYRYRIRSVNKFGESLPMISRVLTPHDMPLKRMCPEKDEEFVEVEGVTRDSIDLIWEDCFVHNNGTSTFQVEKMESDSNIWQNLGKTDRLQMHFSGLKCRTEYRFRVTVFTPDCKPLVCETMPITTTDAPEPPPMPINIGVDDNTLNMDWTLPSIVCGTPIMGYIIEKQIVNSNEWLFVAKTQENKFQDTNIANSHRYRIKSINKFGESLPLISKVLRPHQMQPCPRKPQGIVKVEEVSRDSVLLEWGHCIPDKDGNYSFQIEKSESGSGVWEPEPVIKVLERSVTQLKCHTEYSFRVKVFYPNCETITLETKPTLTSGAPEPPPMPINVEVLNRETLNMDWTLPPIVCGTPIMGYIIEKQYIDSIEWQFVGKTVENRFQDTNISHSYRYRIKSINKHGQSLPLISGVLTPQEMLPKAKCPKKPKGMVANGEVTRDSVNLNWQNCIIDKDVTYTSQIEKAESGSNVWQFVGKTYDFQSQVNGLKFHTEYTFRVTVFAQNSEPVILETKPILTSGTPEPPPMPISVEVLDVNTLNMNWGIPPIFGDTPIMGYIIEKQYNTSDEWQFVAKTQENVFQDKFIANTYRYRIRSINKFGESLPLISKFLTPYDMIPKPKCPQKPEGVLEEDVLTRDSVLLRWDQCIKDPNGNYTFKIEKMESSSGIWETLGNLNDFQTYATDLKCRTKYQFRVFVFTPNCETVTLPSNIIETSGLPDPPIRPFYLTVFNLEKLEMTWTPTPAVCDTPILGYIIEKQFEASEEWRLLGRTEQSRYEDIDIAKTFRYSIKTVNQWGESVPLISYLVTPHEILKRKSEEQNNQI